MNWLRIAAGAFVAVVVIALVFGLVAEHVESYYQGSYRDAFGQWTADCGTCLLVIGIILLFVGALLYAIQGRLW